MDFTREPIIETVVTPKEGCKLVVRSSKSGGQEEYFVDAVEIVSFGSSVFFRSQERPKAFIVPASDYEILEVREARMVLKNVGLDRSIKIGGGRDNNTKPVKEIQVEKAPIQIAVEEEAVQVPQPEVAPQVKQEGRKKDRRRQYRRRRGREEDSSEDGDQEAVHSQGESTEKEGSLQGESQNVSQVSPSTSPNVVGVILPPPPMLISETISRYKNDALFKGAFYTKEEVVKDIIDEQVSETESELPSETLSELPTIPLIQPEYGSFEASEEEEEAIYQQRTQQPFLKEEDDMPPTIHFGEEEFPEKDYSHPKHDEKE